MHTLHLRQECGGSGLCPHGRHKRVCKECGGSGICEHGRQKQQCKECGGSSICAHGRQKAKCKDCGGSGICVHGRDKRFCKKCGGSGLCVHDRYRAYCKECGGAGLCAHGRQKSKCKECGGSSCTHGRRRTQCKDCAVGAADVELGQVDERRASDDDEPQLSMAIELLSDAQMTWSRGEAEREMGDVVCSLSEQTDPGFMGGSSRRSIDTKLDTLSWAVSVS